jgi:hypothetical protein
MTKRSQQAADYQAEAPLVPESSVVTRLRHTRTDMLGTADEQHYWDCHTAADEIERLRRVILRLADQDATLSSCNGAVTVTVDATLTPEERDAIERAMGGYIAWMEDNVVLDTPEVQAVLYRLRGILERLK